jgi:hypothetical protein
MAWGPLTGRLWADPIEGYCSRRGEMKDVGGLRIGGQRVQTRLMAKRAGRGQAGRPAGERAGEAGRERAGEASGGREGRPGGPGEDKRGVRRARGQARRAGRGQAGRPAGERAGQAGRERASEASGGRDGRRSGPGEGLVNRFRAPAVNSRYPARARAVASSAAARLCPRDFAGNWAIWPRSVSVGQNHGWPIGRVVPAPRG